MARRSRTKVLIGAYSGYVDQRAKEVRFELTEGRIWPQTHCWESRASLMEARLVWEGSLALSSEVEVLTVAIMEIPTAGVHRAAEWVILLEN